MLPRLLAPVHYIGRIASARAFHTATADFISHGPDGALITSKVSITIGEAYVLIPPEVGRALYARNLLINGSVSADRSALSYFHDSQHFAHSKSGFVRVLRGLC